MGILQDKNRFLDIVKGKVRDNLKKYVSHGSIVGKQEDKFIKIPLPQIDIPNFRYGAKNNKGVGQGEGQEGDGTGDGQGLAKPGQDPGDHNFDVELSIEDLAEILGQELNLPNLEAKGSQDTEVIKRKYNSLQPTGPQGLKHFKSSYKRALQRAISSGIYTPENPMIVPIKNDFRFRSAKEIRKPQTKAVVFYLMDVSGSMGTEEKEIVQIEIFWINAWIKKHYKNVDVKFIIHDAQAKEVNESEFFSISSGGGTLISSSYKLCQEMIESKYSPMDWNIYVFQFSDGDNWSGEDTKLCLNMIQNYFLKVVNAFNYGQVQNGHGSGQYYKDLRDMAPNKKLVLSKINGREGILNSIKDFFKG